MTVELIQPWSSIVMKTKVSDEIVKIMLGVTDNIISSKNKVRYGHRLAGQIDSEYEISNDILEKNGVADYLCDITRYYMSCVHKQVSVGIAKIPDPKFDTKIVSCWFNDMYPNTGEYNPIHSHMNCSISSVFYLKVPNKKSSIKNTKFKNTDGNIAFIGTDRNSQFDFNTFEAQFSPEVGDLFVFPHHMLHTVYPFRSDDPNDIRRSVAFNSIHLKNTK